MLVFNPNFNIDIGFWTLMFINVLIFNIKHNEMERVYFGLVPKNISADFVRGFFSRLDPSVTNFELV